MMQCMHGCYNAFMMRGLIKITSINQYVDINEMCTNMFRDICEVMNNDHRTWQQDGARAHTARDTVEWLRVNTPDFIQPDQWPSKSPDLNVMDFCVWGILLQKLQLQRRNITTIDDLKLCLMDAWIEIPQDIIKKATESWIKRLITCRDNHGDHFEHLL